MEVIGNNKTLKQVLSISFNVASELIFGRTAALSTYRKSMTGHFNQQLKSNLLYDFLRSL
ncbi:hypothetical protein Fluta_3472 [Fluviicola taffensis DSM 16823]|uniref:Uncharacterized protein n=1 Tax=Fluviicola taffensis (strain DSM 16823 / NCIMB 13979 / RW262) TaxID=755732 RepID=F2ICH4_FLUTR|nr:hypothetical protein Fluta_3472 [Fluviicola taffensis DSM 16823]